MPRKGGKNSAEFGDSDLTLRLLDRGEELVVFLYRTAGLTRLFNHDNKAPTMIARRRHAHALALRVCLTLAQRLTGGPGTGLW